MRPKTYLFPGTEKGWRADKPILVAGEGSSVPLPLAQRRRTTPKLIVTAADHDRDPKSCHFAGCHFRANRSLNSRFLWELT